ncbi:MAG: MFS transporter [Sporolactobacillus sp.]
MQTRYYQSFRFTLLLGTVFICGLAEGMLLPLISSILEEQGVPAFVNGIGTSALYIGMLVCSLFMERPMQKFGYRPFLFYGLLLITISLFLFPIAINIWYWFVLRLAIGVGDSMLHFAAQTWITVRSPVQRRGRNIAFYGLSFGIGFAVGPVLVRLLAFGLWMPFLAAGFCCLLFAIPLLRLRNEYPDAPVKSADQSNRWTTRYKIVIFAAWSGLVSTFCYGFLDASLNNSFPIFALRSGYHLNDISILLPAFWVGGLLTQLPIGMLGDRIGRKIILPLLTLSGGCIFIIAGFVYHSFYGLFFTFLICGMLIGSLYSMSMSYVSDMLDRPLLPLGNILLSIFYSIGCMTGPVAGNLLIGQKPDGRLFFGFSFMLLLISFSTALHQMLRTKHLRTAQQGLSGKKDWSLRER